MKKLLFIVFSCGLFLTSCSGNKKIVAQEESQHTQASDTIHIANEDTEYEIIIFEVGFGAWLQSTARPEGYYSQQFLETRNRIFVNEWNRRVLQPTRFNNTLYEQQIDYRPNIDYGYDVNYKLYYYFVYFQQKYRQRLSNNLVRI